MCIYERGGVGEPLYRHIEPCSNEHPASRLLYSGCTSPAACMQPWHSFSTMQDIGHAKML